MSLLCIRLCWIASVVKYIIGIIVISIPENDDTKLTVGFLMMFLSFSRKNGDALNIKIRCIKINNMLFNILA